MVEICVRKNSLVSTPFNKTEKNTKKKFPLMAALTRWGGRSMGDNRGAKRPVESG